MILALQQLCRLLAEWRQRRRKLERMSTRWRVETCYEKHGDAL